MNMCLAWRDETGFNKHKTILYRLLSQSTCQDIFSI